MAPTFVFANADLAITLAGVGAPAKWFFAAGDTVSGSVVRRSPIVSPKATVTVALFGRVKTKLKVSRGQSHNTYRGRWQLLGSGSQLLFSGPLHLSSQETQGGGGGGDGVLSWPFAIPIPSGPDDSVDSDHFAGESFVPLGKDSVARHTLPGTYTVSPYGGGSWEGYVEYYLQAELQHTRDQSRKSDVAVQPIALRHPKPSQPLVSYEPQECVTEQKVRSQRLLPGMEHARLNFKQKTQKLFNTSTVPEFHFRVEISSPRVLQMDNPWPIPFTLRVVADRGKTSDVIRDDVQKIQLNWVNMTLKAEDAVRAPGNWIDSVHDESCDEKSDLCLDRVFRNLDSPVELSCNHGDKEKENNLVNLGNMFGLVFGANGLVANNQRLTTYLRLNPDFETFNISHRNTMLNWKVSLTVAGETITAQVKTGLRILAAS